MIKGTIKRCLKKTHNDPIISVFEINPGNFFKEKQFAPGGGDPPWSHFTASLVTKDKITK